MVRFFSFINYFFFIKTISVLVFFKQFNLLYINFFNFLFLKLKKLTKNLELFFYFNFFSYLKKYVKNIIVRSWVFNYYKYIFYSHNYGKNVSFKFYYLLFRNYFFKRKHLYYGYNNKLYFRHFYYMFRYKTYINRLLCKDLSTNIFVLNNKINISDINSPQFNIKYDEIIDSEKKFFFDNKQYKILFSKKNIKNDLIIRQKYIYDLIIFIKLREEKRNLIEKLMKIEDKKFFSKLNLNFVFGKLNKLFFCYTIRFCKYFLNNKNIKHDSYFFKFYINILTSYIFFIKKNKQSIIFEINKVKKDVEIMEIFLSNFEIYLTSEDESIYNKILNDKNIFFELDSAIKKLEEGRGDHKFSNMNLEVEVFYNEFNIYKDNKKKQKKTIDFSFINSEKAKNKNEFLDNSFENNNFRQE
jgi:hypothetical protein